MGTDLELVNNPYTQRIGSNSTSAVNEFQELSNSEVSSDCMIDPASQEEQKNELAAKEKAFRKGQKMLLANFGRSWGNQHRGREVHGEVNIKWSWGGKSETRWRGGVSFGGRDDRGNRGNFNINRDNDGRNHCSVNFGHVHSFDRHRD